MRMNIGRMVFTLEKLGNRLWFMTRGGVPKC